MCGVPAEKSAVGRARWLAQLSDALNDARAALASLSLRDDQWPEARDLFVRIEAARVEVEMLRLSRSLNVRSEISPKWTEISPWTDRA